MKRLWYIQPCQDAAAIVKKWAWHCHWQWRWAGQKRLKTSKNENEPVSRFEEAISPLRQTLISNKKAKKRAQKSQIKAKTRLAKILNESKERDAKFIQLLEIEYQAVQDRRFP